MTHRMDLLDWCERCGLSALAIVNRDLACVEPPPDVLAARRLDAIQASAPIVRVAREVIARMQDQGDPPW
jgi:hypothetical protein